MRKALLARTSSKKRYSSPAVAVNAAVFTAAYKDRIMLSKLNLAEKNKLTDFNYITRMLLSSQWGENL